MRTAALLLLLAAAAGCSSPRRAAAPRVPQHGPSVQAQQPGRLILSDGSAWQVQPAGQSASLRWRPGEPLTVIRSGHPAWPFLLTSRVNGAAALARPFPAF
jgi:hypothetical protein